MPLSGAGRVRRPNDVAVLGVESEETIRADGLVAPSAVDDADEYQARIERRAAADAAAVTGNTAEFFRQLPLPDDLAALGVETEQKAARAVGKDTLVFLVAGQGRPAQAVGDDIGMENVEGLFPIFAPVLASKQVTRSPIRCFSSSVGTPGGSLSAPRMYTRPVHDQRRGARAVRLFPNQVVLARRTRVPLVRQVLFG